MYLSKSGILHVYSYLVETDFAFNFRIYAKPIIPLELTMFFIPNDLCDLFTFIEIFKVSIFYAKIGFQAS